MEDIVRKKVLECAINLGLVLNENNEDYKNNVELSIEDSMEFITFVVEIEQTLDIEIPDIYLSIESFKSLDSIVGVVNQSIDSEKI